MTRAAVLDQAALWDLDPAGEQLADQAAAPTRRPTHTPRPRRSKEAQAEECDPTCLVCGKAEGRGLCSPRCATACVHTAQPDLVEICLITTRVTARLVIGIHGYEPGRRLALVDRCPHCERTHWHAAHYGTHYRLAHCGQPYLVTLARPHTTPGAALSVTHSHQQQPDDHPDTTTATRGAAAARAALRGHP